MRVASLSAVLAVLFLASNASAQAFCEPPARPGSPAVAPPPYTFEKIVRTNPPLRAYALKLDLTDPRVNVAIVSGGPDPDGDGPMETVLQPPSAIARAHDLDIAINGVFFAISPEAGKAYVPGTPARGVNMVVSDGKTLCAARGGASILFDRKNQASIGALQAVPKDAHNIMTGSAQIVFRGQCDLNEDNDRAPRTAVGLTKDKQSLIILVVDGRRPEWSVGMTIKELGDEMVVLGCDSAINLDGGGSSTLVMRDGDKPQVVNLPSDGSQLPLGLSVERSVPYVLGFRIRDPAAPGATPTSATDATPAPGPATKPTAQSAR
jgi:hypothetical protein